MLLYLKQIPIKIGMAIIINTNLGEKGGFLLSVIYLQFID